MTEIWVQIDTFETYDPKPSDVPGLGDMRVKYSISSQLS